MNSLNRHEIIGYCGMDPEVTDLEGRFAANVLIATNQQWKDKTTGEKKEKTQWHNVVFYSPLAEIAKDHLKKGSRVYVAGRSQTNTWKDKNNIDRYITEIIAQELVIFDKPKDEAKMSTETQH